MRKLNAGTVMAQPIANVEIGTVSNGDTQAFDKGIALSRVGGDFELLQEIAQLFLEDSPRMLSDIQSAVQTRDAKNLDRSAHTLKGCVLNFGAQRLYEAALALERMGRGGDLTDVETAFRSVEREVHSLEAELRSLLSTAP